MAVLYVVAGWVVLQVADVVIGLGILPDWIGPLVFALLLVGFPIALVLSWFYEITPEGIARDEDVARTETLAQVKGRRVDFIVIALLAAAVILFAYDKWWIGPPPEKSVAVLPFLNLSDDPEQGYFSDGVSEELLNVLAKYPDLKVAARQSSFVFKDKDLPVAEIGRQLHVAHVVEGSVRRSGDRLRITAQLINAEDGYHLWSDMFDREFDDVFAIQDEIAREIGEALRIEFELAGGGKVPPSVIRAADIDAYDVYLEGRNLVHRRDPGSLEQAIRHFERALRLDANFAPAHAQLAIAAMLEIQHGARLPEDARLLAVPHIERALELEPDLAEAHGASALLALFEPDPETAITHAERALALNPSYSDALTWKAVALELLGRFEESFEAYRQVLDVDPLNIIGLRNYAQKLGDRGRTAEAHELADRLITVSPIWACDLHAVTSLLYEGKIAEGLYWALKQDREAGEPVGYATYALSFVGEYDESRRLGSVAVPAEEDRLEAAIERTQRALRRDPNNIERLTMAAIVLADAGRLDEALPLLERALELSPEGRPIAFRYPIVATTLLAEGRRRSGDEAAAQSAAVLARDEYAARVAAGLKGVNTDLWGALIAAFDRDYDAAIDRLRSSIHRGLRDKTVFASSEFDELRDDPRFIAVQQELDEILAEEREKVLQLICFNNPVPDNWRPLPETCEGVNRES
jgi:TolB-like protein/Flp pilus assembly protein TadD